jgi:hypothetical protein
MGHNTLANRLSARRRRPTFADQIPKFCAASQLLHFYSNTHAATF